MEQWDEQMGGEKQSERKGGQGNEGGSFYGNKGVGLRWATSLERGECRVGGM